MKKFTSFIATTLSKIIPIKKNKIIFESGRGRADDNSRYLYEYLKKNRPKLNLKYFIQKTTDHSGLDSKDIVYYNTLKYFYHISSAKVLIKCNSVRSIVDKKNNQVYIQVWHGAEFKNCNPKPSTLLPVDHIKEWDLFVANDDLQERLIRMQTGYAKEILTLGMVRTDYLIEHKNQKSKIFKDKIGVNSNKRTVLYAPTFRDLDLNLDQDELMEKMNIVIDSVIDALKKDDILLLRLHPLLKGFIAKKEYDIELIDVSPVEKVEDLLLAADILITDYSSIIYDYSTLLRPVFLFTYDNEEYVNFRGEHYLDLESEVPGICVNSKTQLRQVINELDSGFDKSRVSDFNKRFNKYNDGKVGHRLAEIIDQITT